MSPCPLKEFISGGRPIYAIQFQVRPAQAANLNRKLPLTMPLLKFADLIYAMSAVGMMSYIRTHLPIHSL